jgi:hypothetical protein
MECILIACGGCLQLQKKESWKTGKLEVGAKGDEQSSTLVWQG